MTMTDEDCFYQFVGLHYEVDGQRFNELIDEYLAALRWMPKDRVAGVKRFVDGLLGKETSDSQLRDIWTASSGCRRVSDGHWRLAYETVREAAAKVLATPE